jgi:hypothetical protein
MIVYFFTIRSISNQSLKFKYLTTVKEHNVLKSRTGKKILNQSPGGFMISKL